jgi:hypothetical protein
MNTSKGSFIMSHFFVSHSSVDKEIADNLIAAIENAGLKGWIAPRDIPPGSNYGAEISRGMRECAALVIIFSENSNVSAAIFREVQMAFELRKIIIPVRIHKIQVSDDLNFYLSGLHWCDLDLQNPDYTSLVQAAKKIVNMPADEPKKETPPQPQPAPQPPPQPAPVQMPPLVQHVQPHPQMHYAPPPHVPRKKNSNAAIIAVGVSVLIGILVIGVVIILSLSNSQNNQTTSSYNPSQNRDRDYSSQRENENEPAQSQTQDTSQNTHQQDPPPPPQYTQPPASSGVRDYAQFAGVTDFATVSQNAVLIDTVANGWFDNFRAEYIFTYSLPAINFVSDTDLFDLHLFSQNFIMHDIIALDIGTGVFLWNPATDVSVVYVYMNEVETLSVYIGYGDAWVEIFALPQTSPIIGSWGTGTQSIHYYEDGFGYVEDFDLSGDLISLYTFLWTAQNGVLTYQYGAFAGTSWRYEFAGGGNEVIFTGADGVPLRYYLLDY